VSALRGIGTVTATGQAAGGGGGRRRQRRRRAAGSGPGSATDAVAAPGAVAAP
jgi:hypothetical protein